MDVVYPVRDGPRLPDDHLMYSVRSVVANLPNVDRVVLVGAMPPWANPDTVTHIPTMQHSTKFVNIGINLVAALERGDLSERFLWMNDDFFVLASMAEVPLLARLQSCDLFCDRLRLHPQPKPPAISNHNDFIYGVRSQRDILQAWGVDTSTAHNTDGHFPIPIDRDRLIDILARVRAINPAHPLGHFRMIYGAQLPAERLQDPKIAGMNTPLPRGWQFVSTYKNTWQGMPGRQLRTMFRFPTRYESIAGAEQADMMRQRYMARQNVATRRTR